MNNIKRELKFQIYHKLLNIINNYLEKVSIYNIKKYFKHKDNFLNLLKDINYINIEMINNDKEEYKNIVRTILDEIIEDKIAELKDSKNEKLITKFNTYIKENKYNQEDYIKKYGFSGNNYNEIIKYFENIFKYMKYLKINKIIKDKKIFIEDIDTYDVVIYITTKNNKISYSFYKNIYKNEVDNYFEFIKDIENQVENFYEILKEKHDLSHLKTSPDNVSEIPILNIEKYCDFIVYCNNKYNNKILNIFLSFIISNNKFNDIKNILYTKYKHLIDANKFDLI